MDQATKSQFEQQTIKYVENKKIYDVLENMLRKLVLYQPSDPLDFLIDHLSHKKPNFVISVVGIDVDIHKICGNISLQLNMKHISLKDQSKKVPEEKIFESLLQEFKTVDKFVNGVLLENFPTTLREAEFLRNNKIVLDRVFTISEEGITEKLAKNNVTHELLDKKEMLESFDGFTVSIDAKDKPHEKISEEIVTMLNYRVKHSIPLRPPRILVINPPGVSFDKLGSQIAQKFGLVHVDATALLDREVEQKSRIGGIISDCFKKNELVPDDLLCGLVYNELTKSTSRVFGWVLTSFPLNSAQFHKYLSWELHPSFVLNVQYKESDLTQEVLEKVEVQNQNFFGQVFVNKSRKNKSYLDEYLKTAQKLKQVVEEKFPNKIETIELGLNAAQINSKVTKLLQNPVYYD